MIMGEGAGGFGSLGDSQMKRAGQFGNSGPMPGPARTGGSDMIRIGQKSVGASPATPPAPSTMPFGQKNDPGAYGTPGATPSSPLGMWQAWLNTMGPYMAQMPVSQPGAESGGLSSLTPSPSYPGPTGYGIGGRPAFDERGFRAMFSQ